MQTRSAGRAFLCFLGLGMACCAPPDESPQACVPLGDVSTAGLKTWLDAKCFEGWVSESGVLEASKSDGLAQVFVNPLLADSLEAGNALHPPGSAAVRVMYLEDQATIWGYAMLFKPMDTPAQSWFWFEHFLHHEDPTVSATEAPGCTGCHSDGADFVQSQWPLR